MERNEGNERRPSKVFKAEATNKSALKKSVITKMYCVVRGTPNKCV